MQTTGLDQSAPRPVYLFSCFSGPDQGKRIALSTERLLLGHAVDCNLLSDDPELGDYFVSLSLDGGKVRIRALTNDLPFVDGHPVTEVLLDPGQQVRLGRSVWQLAAPSAGAGVIGFVTRLGDHITAAAGVEKPRDWNPRETFSEVAKRRSDEDIEDYFAVGTSRTTPPLSAVDPHWPKPWVFVRVFALSLALYVGFVGGWNEFGNLYLIPGLIMTGSVAIPFSLLILFFEINVPRNISLYQVIKLLFIGGLLSIMLSLFGFRWTGLDNWLGAASAGIIEETGKGLALLLVINRPRYRWTLNGLLLGATVGTGFATFESAGYALAAALGNGAEAMRSVILERGLLSVLGGHVLWTGLVGAALWRVRGAAPFRREMLTDPRFLRVFGFCVAMHMAWNAPLPLPFYMKYLALGAVAWLLVLGFIQDGLQQVRDAQAAPTAGATADLPATPVVAPDARPSGASEPGMARTSP
jgi:RsiW-degrading membrane proteinase PrsW (M82 family)